MASTEQTRQQLSRIIKQWNETRIDLFSLSEPNEDLEFFGVMRFYFQEQGQRVATKCLRVSSTATTSAVIEALGDKFHPDMKMLNEPVYALYEEHETGAKRQLAVDEKPLLVQLNWHKDNREGRFVLRHENAPQYLPLNVVQLDNNVPVESSMKRKLSKRDKKKMEKRQRHNSSDAKLRSAEAEDLNKSIYDEVPPTTFTRTISNPEIVMKKRRERQVQKLRHMGEGGSLKIYGMALSPNRPYVTLLVAANDNTHKIIKETLDKYGLDKHKPDVYCLLEVQIASDENATAESVADARALAERVLDDDEYPLHILNNSNAHIVFHIRHRPASHPSQTRTRRTSASSLHNTQTESAPYLVQLTPDGVDMPEHRPIRIRPDLTHVGSDPQLAHSQSILLYGPYVHPRHCVLTYMDGLVTITPCAPNAEIHVNGQTIMETTILRHNSTLRIGRSNLLRYIEPNHGSGTTTMQTVSATNTVHNGDYGSLPRSVSMPLKHANTSARRSKSKNKSRESGESPIYEEIFACAPHKRVEETIFEVDGAVNQLELDIDLVEGASTMQRSVSVVQLAPASHHHNHMQHHINFSTDQLHKLIQPAHERKKQRHDGQRLISSMQRVSSASPFIARDSIPALVELPDNGLFLFAGAWRKPVEDAFLVRVIVEADVDNWQFKLAPAYMLYMCCRYRVSPHYRTSLMPHERAAKLAGFLTKVTQLMHNTVQEQSSDVVCVLFWLANSSELLHFSKGDYDLCHATSPEPQEAITQLVQRVFDYAHAALTQQLMLCMTDLLDMDCTDQMATGSLLQQLSVCMSVLRACNVNASFTIQLYSRLFHTINSCVFNWLCGLHSINQSVANALYERLSLIEHWAEQQGLEQAAECHLDRLVQALTLLRTPKTSDHVTALGQTCYKLNSAQVHHLLSVFVDSQGNQSIDPALIHNLVTLAEQGADAAVLNEGDTVQLLEYEHLGVPFVLPDDGYSMDVLKGVPVPLQNLVHSLQRAGLCRLVLQPQSSGTWTVHFHADMTQSTQSSASGSANQQPPSNGTGLVAGSTSYTPSLGSPTNQTTNPITQNGVVAASGTQPQILNIGFAKDVNGGIGLSIVVAQAMGEPECGIYVKKVVPGSAAEKDGRLAAGDQLLSVNAHSLLGITQEKAAALMAGCVHEVHFSVGKRAAMHKGLASLIQQPAPNTAPPQSGNLTTPPAHRPPVNGQALPGMMQGALSGPGHTLAHRHHSDEQPPPAYGGSSTATAVSRGGTLPAQNTQHKTLPSNTHERYASSSAIQPAAYNQSQPYNTNGNAPRSQRSLSATQLWYQQQQQQRSALNANGDTNTNSTPAPAQYYALPKAAGTVSPKHTGYDNGNEAPKPLSQQSADGSNTSLHAVPSNAANYQNVYGNCGGHRSSASPTAWERDNRDRQDMQMSAQVLQLFCEEIEQLEAKASLNDEELKRYKTLKYEVTYRQRLADEENNALGMMDNNAEHVGTGTQRTSADSVTNVLNTSAAGRQKFIRAEDRLQLRADKLQRQQNEQLALQKERDRQRHQQQTTTPTHEHEHNLLQHLNELTLNTQHVSHDVHAADESLQRSAALVAAGTATHNPVQSPSHSYTASSMTTTESVSPPSYYGSNEPLPAPSNQPVKRPPAVPPKRTRPVPPPVLHGQGTGTQINGVHVGLPPGTAPLATADSDSDVHSQTHAPNYVYGEAQQRTQVLGTQEIYANDPRQRRLAQITQNNMSAQQQSVDGSHLPFREKMRLFASQIGENTPKDKMKASSAQRDIETTNQHTPTAATVGS